MAFFYQPLNICLNGCSWTTQWIKRWQFFSGPCNNCTEKAWTAIECLKCVHSAMPTWQNQTYKFDKLLGVVRVVVGPLQNCLPLHILGIIHHCFDGLPSILETCNALWGKWGIIDGQNTEVRLCCNSNLTSKGIEIFLNNSTSLTCFLWMGPRCWGIIGPTRRSWGCSRSLLQF